MRQTTLEDFIFNEEHGVFDLTVNGKCSKCGNCCSNCLPLTDGEIKDIKAYIKEHDIKEQAHGLRVLSGPYRDMICPFLDDSKELKCTIYPVRPSVCKLFLCSRGTPKQLSKAGRKPIDVRATFLEGQHD